MFSFKRFIKESEMFGVEVYEKKLSSMGFDVSRVSGKKLVIKTDKNRVEVLNSIASEFSGSTYRKDYSGSSVGAVITRDGVAILAKPTKSSGSGGGAALTALTESAQCLYCAAVWYGNSKFSKEDLKSMLRYIDVTDSFDKMINDLPGDWQDSAINIAKRLKEEFGGKSYTFHRGSRWVETLSKKFNSLNKLEKEFSNLNKWSPADIYMLSAVGENETFSQANSILEINATLLKHIRNKDIVPVSLKKVSSRDVSIKYVNVTDNRSTYEIGRPVYTTGKRGFFESKDVYINFVSGEIQFRGFNVVDFQGEIKGKYAAHGKVGGGIIKNIIKRHTGFDMETPREVANRFAKNKEALYKDFHKYYIGIDGGTLPYSNFVLEASKKDLGWHISKYLGSQMLYFIKNSPKSKMDAIVGSIIGYAASESEISAPYVKVS